MPNWGFVWMVAWPDFTSRLRRFLVIGFGMALVLAITLLLSAFSEGFNLRGERLLDVFGADHYVVVEGSSGPMTSTSPMPADLAEQIAAAPGVDAAIPLFFRPNAILADGQPAGIMVIATPPDAAWMKIVEGRAPAAPDEIAADLEVYELSLDDQVIIAGRNFTVVGRTERATWDIATAGIFMDRDVALEIFAQGQNVATTIAVFGASPDVPAGYEVHTRSVAVADVVSRTSDAKRSIDSFKATLWVLAVVIVAAVLYLAALERVRDFAIFKATGASNIDLVFGLGLQAAIVGAIAGVLAIGLAHLMKPIYPGLLSLPFSIAWPVIPVAIIISVLSSVVGVRRAIKVDPSQAFG